MIRLLLKAYFGTFPREFAVIEPFYAFPCDGVKLLRPTHDGREQVLQCGPGIGHEPLLHEIPHEGVQGVAVGLHAVGVGVAAEQLVDLVQLGVELQNPFGGA